MSGIDCSNRELSGHGRLIAPRSKRFKLMKQAVHLDLKITSRYEPFGPEYPQPFALGPCCRRRGRSPPKIGACAVFQEMHGPFSVSRYADSTASCFLLGITYGAFSETTTDDGPLYEHSSFTPYRYLSTGLLNSPITTRCSVLCQDSKLSGCWSAADLCHVSRASPLRHVENSRF